MNFSYTSLPEAAFTNNDLDKGVNLRDVESAALFGHEAAHTWQRNRGRWVTLQGLYLKITPGNEYKYQKSSDPDLMLEEFLNGTVEQQGAMIQNYIRKSLDPTLYGSAAPYSGIASYLKTSCNCKADFDGYSGDD